MNREAAVRAAAEALRESPSRFRCEFHRNPEPDTCDTCLSDAEDARYDAETAVDAAAPHLTADLEREHNEALAEVERLRVHAEDARGFRDAWKARAKKAEASIARVEALCKSGPGVAADDGYIFVGHILDALRGDA